MHSVPNNYFNSGTLYPAITILLSDLVRKEGGKILSYDHFDNDLHIIDSDGDMTTEKLAGKIDVESYLMLLDYSIVSKTTVKQLSSRKTHIMELYKMMKKMS